VLVGNQQDNRVTIQAPTSGGNGYTPVQTLGTPDTSASAEAMAPGDVEWSVLDRGATLPDAVVVSTGSNAVVVYRTTSVRGGAPTFAPDPQTYFVGTAPAGVTVADVNGDGIPDMLVANEGSNDVSVLFGFYGADGGWVGVPGPRLKSGGDGPIEVRVSDPDGNRVPDLAVVNGGSGTITLLPGVGRGFFDDQRPQTLFNLGDALLQPPTFSGDSTLGFAVTAGGDIVRFDLNDPADGAGIVYDGGQVVAAQALPDGQVVAALANGTVNLLVPRGNGLGVASELRTTGAAPALPSAIQVVSRPGGLLDVLVSSQGSDTISVFGQTAAVSPVAVSLGASAAASFGSAASASATTTTVVALTASPTATGTSTSATAATSSASTSAGPSSSTTGAPVGLSLGTFTSLGNGPAKGTGDTLLVSVEGNTYVSVPILDFGSEGDDAAGEAERPMPWLSTAHPVGDTSPLTRFVTGFDDAARDYRGPEDAPAPGTAPGLDPWYEDLFAPHRPARPPAPALDKEGPKPGGGPEAFRPDRAPDEPDGPPPSPTARVVVGFQTPAALLASLFLTRAAAVPTPGEAAIVSSGWVTGHPLRRERAKTERARVALSRPPRRPLSGPWQHV
jgi:hypothetical protein